jgi:hypothetical protein
VLLVSLLPHRSVRRPCSHTLQEIKFFDTLIDIYIVFILSSANICVMIQNVEQETDTHTRTHTQYHNLKHYIISIRKETDYKQTQNNSC